MIIANHTSLLMLDASRPTRFGLSTPQMQVAGRLHSSRTWEVEKRVVCLPLCCNETKTRVLKWAKFCISLTLTAEMSTNLSSEGLERKFVRVISLSDIRHIWMTLYKHSTMVLKGIEGLERNLSKGLEMSQKWILLVITLEPLGVGAEILQVGAHLVWAPKFKSHSLRVFEILLFLCLYKLPPNLLIRGHREHNQPIYTVKWGIWNLMADTTFGLIWASVHPKC